MKSTIETHREFPQVFKGPVGKKQHLKKMRDKEIKEENRILLEKMQGIFKAKPKIIQTTKLKSLNINARKQEATRINQQNTNLYKHLSNIKSEYSREELAKWNKTNQKYKQNLKSRSSISPLRPIVTPGLAKAYPELKKLPCNTSRSRASVSTTDRGKPENTSNSNS